MKVTTEKLPKSLLALDIELDRAQVEKGLERAARRISQRVNIPGFRKGKAPRFIVENYFGRAALVEEASEDLINRSFREVLEQEKIDPVGQANLEEVFFDEEPFHFRVTVPVAPTVTLPDYRAIRLPLKVTEITDEAVQQAMEQRREQHVVLREPEEERPAQAGDQLTVHLQSFVDGQPLDEDTADAGEEEEAEDADDERDEDTEAGSEARGPESTLVMDPERLTPGLFEGLLGITPGETREVTVQMADDHPNERVRGKEVTFKVTLKRVQERLLPDWEELPVLEEFEGTLDELREKTRTELIETARQQAERETVDAYIRQLVEQTTYDVPDALVEQEADHMLHEQEQRFERYGVTLEQVLQYRGQTHDQAVEELKPQAEERLKTTLALREIIRAENLSIDDSEIEAEVARLVETYKEEERETARNLLSTHLRSTVASGVLNQKLQQRLLAIATGHAEAEETSRPAGGQQEQGAPTAAESAAPQPDAPEGPAAVSQAANVDE